MQMRSASLCCFLGLGSTPFGKLVCCGAGQVPVGTTVSKAAPMPSEGDDKPGWTADWHRPWVGARDYQSEDDSDGAENGALAPVQKEASDRDAPSCQIVDLVEDGQQACVARGGAGGRGNAAFRSRPNRLEAVDTCWALCAAK